MEVNLINQTALIIMFAVILGLLITALGFFGLQHQGLFQDIKQDSDQADNRTRVIIVNVTGEASNLTKAILKNMTYQIELHDELINSKVDRAMGIAVRTHNDVQQLLERSNNETNSTSRILDILPSFR